MKWYVICKFFQYMSIMSTLLTYNWVNSIIVLNYEIQVQWSHVHYFGMKTCDKNKIHILVSMTVNTHVHCKLKINKMLTAFNQPQTIKHKKEQGMWHWKSMPWFGQGKTCGSVRLVRPKKNMCVFTVTCQKNLGSVGWD